jgi:thioredoxin family protein
MSKGDVEGARKDFAKATEYSKTIYTIEAWLGLAAIDVRAGKLEPALESLRSAVGLGSIACNMIAAQKVKAFAPLFNADNDAIKKEMEKLTDPREGDAPIRAEIAAACAKAKAEGKEVLLEWYGPYCPFVMAMQERLARPEVASLIDENFILVRMNQGDVDKGIMRGATLDEEYGNVMESCGVPSFFVLKEDGSIRTVQKDIPLMSEDQRGYDVEAIVTWLTEVVAERE